MLDIPCGLMLGKK